MEQQRQCAELRVAGQTIDAVASRVGIAPETVQTRIDEYYAAHPAAGADQMRGTLLARYEAIWAAIYPRAVSGELAAIDTALKVMQDVRKLTGVDAPVRIEADVSHHVAPEDIELVRMISKLEGSNRTLVQGHAETESTDA